MSTSEVVAVIVGALLGFYATSHIMANKSPV